MNHKIKKILDELRLKDHEKATFFHDINRKNITILKYSIMVMIPLNILYMTLFTFMLVNEPNSDALWKKGIISLHFIDFITFLAIGLYTKFNREKIINQSKEPQILHLFYAFFLFNSMLITAFDQLVTNAITPYLLTAIAIPVIFVFRFSFAIALSSIAFIVFMIIMPYFQSDRNALFSNLINSFTVLAVSIFLIVINWKYNLSKFRQDRIIQEQKQELQTQNMKLSEIANELTQSNATKDKFFSIIAHDLRAPISGFLGISKMLNENLEVFTTNEIQNISQTMHKSANNILELLSNLLEWSKMQQNLVEFKPVETDISFIVRNTIELLKDPIDNKQLTINVQMPNELIILCDPNMISAVFRNLISNSIKFSSKNKSIYVGYHGKDENNSHIFYVKDEGIGMPEQIRENIFKYSANISRKGTSGEPSTGLGLILCKDFINFHNGKIWVESEVNKGSTFYFSI